MLQNPRLDVGVILPDLLGVSGLGFGPLPKHPQEGTKEEAKSHASCGAHTRTVSQLQRPVSMLLKQCGSGLDFWRSSRDKLLGGFIWAGVALGFDIPVGEGGPALLFESDLFCKSGCEPVPRSASAGRGS